MPVTSSTNIEERALALLGKGAPNGAVAAALGVTDGRISQLMADPDFSARVQQLRYQGLQRHTEIDEKYDELEDKLVDKLKDRISLMKPMEMVRTLQVVNGAKRRGAGGADGNANMGEKVVSLTMPTIINQRFIQNINSQVTEVRDESGNSQTLVTAQPSSLDQLVSASKEQRQLASSETSSEGSRESSGSKGPITATDL